MSERILIIKPSALGDVALTLGTLSTLRASFPDAKITWFVRKEFAPLIEGHPDLDDMIIFDRKLLGKWWCCPKACAALLDLFKQLRVHKFDLVLDLQGLFRTALFSWITGCKKRFGLSGTREFAGIFYTDKIACDDNNISLVDHYNKIAVAAGATDADVTFKLAVSQEAKQQVTQLCKEQGLDQSRLAVFIAGAAHEYKLWPAEKFAKVAQKLATDHGMQVAVIGTESESSIAQKITAACDVPIVDLCGKTNIPQLAALLSDAKFVLSNDTGPGHIAAASGVPMVMVFGRTNPSRVGPYKRPDASAAVDAFTRGPQIESFDPAHTIDNVSLDTVLGKIKIQLQK
jgi:lipopolysaccharide heptosyltransferase I